MPRLLPSMYSRVFADAISRLDAAVILDWFTTWFFSVGVVFLALALVTAWMDPGFAVAVRVATFGLCLAAASTILGWLLGLLFGIPRSLSRPLNLSSQPTTTAPAGAAAGSGAGSSITTGAAAQTVPDAGARTSRVNTNLEDVSDWLTKTIVGLGLTQLFFMPGYLWRKAAQINDYGLSWDKHGQVFVLLTFAYFSVGGFWIGYVTTRTLLTMLFDQIDRDPNRAAVAKSGNPSELQLDPSGRGILPATDSLAAADRQVLATPLEAMNSATQLAARGAARARSGDLSSARTLMGEAATSDPANRNIQAMLATLDAALGQDSAASFQPTQAPSAPAPAQRDLLKEPPPDGFRKAISIGETPSVAANGANDSGFHVDMARAYGQQYAYEKAQGAQAEALAAIKDKALSQIQAAISLDPATRNRLRSLWQPPAASQENDLQAIGDAEPEIAAVLS